MLYTFAEFQIQGYVGRRTELGGGKVLKVSIAATDSWKDKDSGELRERTEVTDIRPRADGRLQIVTDRGEVEDRLDPREGLAGAVGVHEDDLRGGRRHGAAGGRSLPGRTALAHRGERRGDVVDAAVREPGVHPDRGEHVRIGRAEHRGHGAGAHRLARNAGAAAPRRSAAA